MEIKVNYDRIKQNEYMSCSHDRNKEFGINLRFMHEGDSERKKQYKNMFSNKGFRMFESGLRDEEFEKRKDGRPNSDWYLFSVGSSMDKDYGKYDGIQIKTANGD